MGVGEGKTVLVVDDDESLRMLCRINLELDGYRVLEAGSIEDAQLTLETDGVDAILLDLHVGQGDGRQLLANLGPDRPPVALFTGSEAIGPELHAVADAVLAKPFGIELLGETVGRLIAGRAR
jgi:DNA-binding response OmpR family regulator